MEFLTSQVSSITPQLIKLKDDSNDPTKLKNKGDKSTELKADSNDPTKLTELKKGQY